MLPGVEIAWAAGLFEGEGTITAVNGRPRLALKMVAEASVRRFGAAVGVGVVYGPYGPYRSQLGTQPYFVWMADGPEAAARAAALLGPLVTEPWRSRLAALA